MKRSVFISYRRSDSAAAAGRIRDRLTHELGADRVFMDVSDIPPGMDFEEAITQRIADAAALIAIIGPSWATDPRATGEIETIAKPDYVRLEISAALKAGVRVIPVLIDDAKMPAASDLPSSLKKLSRINALEIRHTKFDSDVSDLVTLLKGLVSRRRTFIGAVTAILLAAVAAVTVQQILLRNDGGSSGTTGPAPVEWDVSVPAAGTTAQTVSIAIAPRDSSGRIDTAMVGRLELAIDGANPQRLAVTRASDGTYHAEYVPQNEGSDHVLVRFDGSPVSGSPFPVIITSRASPPDRPTPTPSRQTARVQLDTRAPATYYVLLGGRTIDSGAVTAPAWIRVPAEREVGIRLIWRVPECSPARDTIWTQSFTLRAGEERRIPTKFNCWQ